MSITIITPRADAERREYITRIAERHEIAFLARLLAKARRDGPDGEVIRNRGEVAELECLIGILRAER